MEIFGHFKGAKGLRQGDPLSPLLFTVAMEYFSRIMAFTTDTMPFKFHPMCGKLRLSHLMFADDLLLFSKGDIASIMVLLRSFSTFSQASGLQINATKTNAYFQGVSKDIKADVLQVSGFIEGVLNKINSICRHYLWDGSVDYIRVPPVGWDKVCSPKEEGELGIRDSLSWNIAAIGKLVWWIYTCPDRLWVKWVHQVYLKGADWNDYIPTGDVSWGWKVICRTKTKLAHGYTNHQWTLDPKGYSISSGYELLRERFQTVVWHKALWNSWCIPKHQFIGWLIARERLQLKDKLMSLGIVSDANCLLCGEAEESHLHLFLQCRYSQRILTEMAGICHVSWPSSNLINWIGVWQGSALQRNVIMCIVLAAFYHIWMQRNKVRVDACLLRPEYVIQQIKKEVKMKLATKSIQGLTINDVSWLNLVSLSL
ncbi:uncharacterized protein LOC141632823 [Silene latifolia]|uniref:uncharacterized protein LOC141632823 n=1 Tax=Silene latifolia TaxID=37657 RepID=UPI003D76C07F